jgi:hypothetical protein
LLIKNLDLLHPIGGMRGGLLGMNLEVGNPELRNILRKR